MSAQTRSPSQAGQWLNFPRRQVGMWAFVMNRLSAIGLAVYLFLHLFMLRQLAQGPEAYNSFISLVHSPFFVLSEWVVVVGGLYHGLNGIRVILTGLGVGVPYQKQMFWVLFGIAALGSLAFAIRMFTV